MYNPLAQELNGMLEKSNSHVFEMLSELGKSMYFPKGILSQGAEANQKAHKFNATVGIATEHGSPMYLGVIQENLSAYEPKDLYPYAPPAGKPALRKVWKEKMLQENPSLAGKSFGLPIVTNALTHGLSIVADLFADAGDVLIVPDKFWGNYSLTFNIRRGSKTVVYPLFTEQNTFNAKALEDAILSCKDSGKAIVLLNFPNNPTGYTPSAAEGEEIVAAVKRGAEAGIDVVVITDDAYFGLFFEEHSLKESLFGSFVGLHPRVLPIKIDGATKEEYVWGFRVGFITYGVEDAEAQAALEKKTMGIIRGTISNCSHPAQTMILKALEAPAFDKQKEEKYQTMKARANRVKDILDSGKYDDAFVYYPFNSGYFMCLQLKTVDAEALRLHLLDQYGVGTISLGKTDLRIAFSCVELGDIDELFELIYKGVKDLEQA
ncbi:aminotransferase class I/II-fold pyridoxal phosphate-dependent enzyme [Fodinisporobacter ferrooxydans]|uniref:Aminotransferase class I/II-fold pyridoxal phosphate-dependent enzyme n=1 Tax=Fodinisporobacter ferrooxydans TaxID=2901836 RepID=A0ABY4CSL7_9BACL|nr:aminotransferase class I/II-fold pyridoxal phosphate-dependent enzyme [Alicyclobacillaceae bacterium MYW30-H2]